MQLPYACEAASSAIFGVLGPGRCSSGMGVLARVPTRARACLGACFVWLPVGTWWDHGHQSRDHKPASRLQASSRRTSAAACAHCPQGACQHHDTNSTLICLLIMLQCGVICVPHHIKRENRVLKLYSCPTVSVRFRRCTYMLLAITYSGEKVGLIPTPAPCLDDTRSEKVRIFSFAARARFAEVV